MASSSLILPSYRTGFARNASESVNPHLWRGLIAAYLPNLGITGSRLLDISGKGNHGSFVSMDVSNWVHDELGYSVDSNGSPEYVDCGNDSSLDIGISDLSVLFWIKYTDLGSFVGILSKSTGFAGKGFQIGGQGLTDNLLVHSIIDDVFTFQVRNGSITNDGTWKHVASCFDRSDKLNSFAYLNGVEDTSFRSSNSVTGSIDVPESLKIFRFDSANYVNAQLGPILIYKRYLTQREVRVHHEDPYALVRLKRRPPFIPDTGPPPSNEGAAMYHHLQNIGAY